MTTSEPVAAETVLDRLAGLEAAATSGPWAAGPGHNPYVRGGHFGMPQTVADCRYRNGEADAALIAEARNALPALIAVARAARVLCTDWAGDPAFGSVTDPLRTALARLSGTESGS